MYPSDYGYATSGGSTTSKEECLARGLYSWDDYSDCCNNDWLYNNNSHQRTITPDSGIPDGVFFVFSAGQVYGSIPSISIAVRPALYLSSDVMITGGTGTSSDPYILSK